MMSLGNNNIGGFTGPTHNIAAHSDSTINMYSDNPYNNISFGSQQVNPNSTTPYSDATQCKKKTDHVKRPMNAFMVWSQQERREMIKFQPDRHNADISKELGVRWRALSDADRQPFMKKAEHLRLLHVREYPDYKYRPKKRPSTKGLTSQGSPAERSVPCKKRKAEDGGDVTVKPRKQYVRQAAYDGSGADRMESHQVQQNVKLSLTVDQIRTRIGFGANNTILTNRPSPPPYDMLPSPSVHSLPPTPEGISFYADDSTIVNVPTSFDFSNYPSLLYVETNSPSLLIGTIKQEEENDNLYDFVNLNNNSDNQDYIQLFNSSAFICTPQNSPPESNLESLPSNNVVSPRERNNSLTAPPPGPRSPLLMDLDEMSMHDDVVERLMANHPELAAGVQLPQISERDLLFLDDVIAPNSMPSWILPSVIKEEDVFNQSGLVSSGDTSYSSAVSSGVFFDQILYEYNLYNEEYSSEDYENNVIRGDPMLNQGPSNSGTR